MRGRSVLAPFSLLFDQITRARSHLYKKNIFESVALGKPLVSVGNLTVGGTGKTPFVGAILDQLKRRNIKAAVLTRGYGREGTGTLLVGPSATTRQVGDEPLWLYQKHPEALIVVGRDRVASANFVVTICDGHGAGYRANSVLTTVAQPELFILDDGFQHHRLKRDLEIVLLDVSRPWWHYRMLPNGYARESLDGLKRAAIVVLTRVNQAQPETLNKIRQELGRHPEIKIIESSIIFENCVSLMANTVVAVESSHVFVYCAIGNPKSFVATVNSLGAKVVGSSEGRDHAKITGRVIENILNHATQIGAEFILITEKDAVKWREALNGEDGLARSKSVEKILVVCTQLSFTPALPDIYDLAHHLRR